MKKLTLLAVIVVMLFSCGASALGTGATARGARWALENNSILTNGNLTVFFWPKGAGYGFAVFSNRGDPITELSLFRNGTKDNLRTIADFGNFLKGLGYVDASPDGLPVWMVSTIRSFRMGLIAGIGTISYYTMWAMPFAFYEQSGWEADVVVQ